MSASLPGQRAAPTERERRERAGVSIRNLSKTFAGTRALAGVDLELEPGSVHALLGKNGSGKSTLFKILSGYHEPDPGAELRVAGEEVELPLRSGEAARLGFSFVHQDLAVVDSISVLENLRVGRFATGRAGRISWRRERHQVQRMLASFGVELPIDAEVGTLTQAERAIVAIVRGLQPPDGTEPTLLVLDEPTAYLPPPGIARLFEAVRGLRAAGVAILLATHRLDEVMEIADRASVLRDGRLVGRLEIAAASEERLIEAIIGRELGELYPEPPSGGGRRIALAARSLAAHPVQGVDLEVHEGEVLGLTGLVGMGQDELPYLLFGARRAAAGRLEVDGEPCDLPSPRRALERGIALLPADRRRASGIQEASLRENLSMPVLGGYFRHGRLDKAAERADARELLERFDVDPRSDPERRLATLSGGNQQKVLLAKWMRSDLRVLLLHEPTQGVDVGSRQVIFELIHRAAERGTAIVLASAEHADLAHLCDRVVVLRYGRVAATLAGAELTEEQIVAQCYRTGL